jgi:hypothetical protein
MDTPIDARVRLLVDTCHGPRGSTVTISSSRARDLIADGRAVAVLVDAQAAEVPVVNCGAPVGPARGEYILVRLIKDQLNGTICHIEAAHARRLIASGFAEEIKS